MIFVWAIAIYLGFLILVSISKSRKVKTQDDFMVAGRGVTATFLVGTLVCTWIGSGSLFGGAGRHRRRGPVGRPRSGHRRVAADVVLLGRHAAVDGARRRRAQ